MKKETTSPLGKEEAMKMLFNKDEILAENTHVFPNDCMDEYGNYIFATDITIAKPNTAYGSASGFNYTNHVFI